MVYKWGQETLTQEPDMYQDEEFTGRALENLVVAIEGAIGGYKAGATPLGAKIIRLCEASIEEDRFKTKQP